MHVLENGTGRCLLLMTQFIRTYFATSCIDQPNVLQIVQQKRGVADALQYCICADELEPCNLDHEVFDMRPKQCA